MFSWFWKRKITGRNLPWWEVINLLDDYIQYKSPETNFEYLLVDDPQYLLRKSNVHKISYTEKRMCKDFTRIFRGWLSKEELGHILAMDIKIWLEEKKESHQVIGFLDINNNIKFGDPQTGKYPVFENAKIMNLII